MCKKDKWSHFNVLFSKNSKFYLYNTLSGGLCEVDESVYSLLCNIEKGHQNVSSLDNETSSYLKKAKYIVKDGEDMKSIRKLRYLKLLKTFQKDRLTLIIAPTLFCNFACPYCYEKNLPNEIMSDDTIEDLIKFIQGKEQDFKYLEICWHGGEPLSAISVIDKILKKIHKEVKIELKGHSMVTNGYLINNHFFNCFEEYPLHYIQITIDGNKISHNKNRISKDGKDTYDQIVHNIDILTEKLPSLRVGIRMNVHKNNEMEFIPLYKELTNRWKGHKVNIYPAFVMENSGCKVSCFNSIEKTTFLFDTYKSIGKKYSMADTNIKTGDCTAIYDNSYVIDPYGDIFKCWVDVGVPDMKIGTLKEGVTNFSIVEKYLLSSDKFSDTSCLKCKLFPICSGGCNKYRMGGGYETKDICPISKDLIPKFII